MLEQSIQRALLGIADAAIPYAYLPLAFMRVAIRRSWFGNGSGAQEKGLR